MAALIAADRLGLVAVVLLITVQGALTALGALVIGFDADRLGLAAAVGISAGAMILIILLLLPLVRRAAHGVAEST